MSKRIKSSIMLAVFACSMLMVNHTKVQAASSQKLNKTMMTMKAGQIKKLKVNGTTKQVKWSVNNKKYAVVTTTGKKVATVTARKAGTVIVKATVGETTLSCKVKIKKSNFQKRKIYIGVHAAVMVVKGKQELVGDVTWGKIKEADGYCIYKKDKKGKKKLVKKIKNGKKTRWLDWDAENESYDKYRYYVCAYKILDNGVIIYGDMGKSGDVAE